MTNITPDIRRAMLTFTYDMNVMDGWAEAFDETVTEAELNEAEIHEAAITFASNLWRSSQEEYDCACERHREQLKGCWARRANLFLKEVRSLYPEASGIPLSVIAQKVRG